MERIEMVVPQKVDVVGKVLRQIWRTHVEERDVEFVYEGITDGVLRLCDVYCELEANWFLKLVLSYNYGPLLLVEKRDLDLVTMVPMNDRDSNKCRDVVISEVLIDGIRCPHLKLE